MLEIEYLPEPKLQFGSFFEHEDSKTGLAEFGPFGKNVAGLHPSAIKLGFIGTRETIAVVEHHGGSSKKDLFREVLELTKMNVNNCSFADGTPITLSFAEKVGEIMKHIPEGEALQTGYKFYM